MDNAPTFSVTPAAAARIAVLKQKQGNDALYFRITVRGGGCSGFQYEFALDESPISATDIVIEKDGSRAVIDDISIGLVAGSQLDYVEDLASAGFEIKNPNATASCGCGNSFSVAL
ncbi:MAG: iron-sulfur cluster assembly accessory protein [Alphaproteobacteria bacterium]|nr:iron-sulfur cluster assembly accessory protein [Alphaproteobacteria bacterium]